MANITFILLISIGFFIYFYFLRKEAFYSFDPFCFDVATFDILKIPSRIQITVLDEPYHEDLLHC